MGALGLATRESCTGCTACMAACAQGAIRMEADGEGFLRPVVDVARCVGCGACGRVCPVAHPGSRDEMPRCFAARAMDVAAVRASSSGGVFPALARDCLAQGGVVFGCVWERPGLRAVLCGVETEGEMEAMRGSKYVQASPENTFREALAALRAGRSVLYSGTPCQLAGLMRFLGRPWSNLLAVEILCHNAPSPAVFARFLEELGAREGASVVDFAFRVKDAGGTWTRRRCRWTLRDGRHGGEPFDGTGYGLAFFGQVCARPSCAQCVAKAGSSGADLTIGDFWGVETVCPGFADDLGCSVVAVHTAKGEAALRRAALTLRSVETEAALRENVASYWGPPPDFSARIARKRAWFMAHYCAMPIRRAALRAIRGPWLMWMLRRMWYLPWRLLRRL